MIALVKKVIRTASNKYPVHMLSWDLSTHELSY